MLSLENLPTAVVVGLFLAAALVIAWAGTRIVPPAERIAVRTGLGQAIFGAVFIGISTSLSGSIMSLYTAGIGHVDLAISNAIGGIAAQTAFLAIGDITLPRRNLEHAAASLQNLAQGCLLVILLTLPLLASVLPEITLFAVSGATPVLVVVYIFGIRLVDRIKDDPMWSPRQTRETQNEPEGEDDEGPSTRRLILVFAGYLVILAAAGLVVARTGVALVERTGLSATVVGSIFTAVCTSLPELITTLTAIRRRAFNLAVGNIIGGNSFDVLFLAGSDVTYRAGSIYHQFSPAHVSIICISILMTGVLLLGMLRRERHGIGGIGFESALVLVLYAFLLAILVW